jgi:dienelactone hydrolase
MGAASTRPRDPPRRRRLAGPGHRRTVEVNEFTASEAVRIPVTVDGRAARLAARIYGRAHVRRRPTLVFNHGSTGNGQDPSLFAQPIDYPEVAQFFTQRGWAVVVPARRGRGGSDGDYDEGFAENRALGYTGDPARSLAGAERALRDIEAVVRAVREMPLADPERLVIGGQSRGGILSVAYAGRRPTWVRGVLNFVGGWLGHPYHPTAAEVNQTLFGRGAAFPGAMLWLYAARDPFYPLAHSRENFASFIRAGGRGTFHEFALPQDESGHRLWAHPEVWGPVVADYLEMLGLPHAAAL